MVTTAKPIIIDKQINISQYLYQYINYYIAIYKDTSTTTGFLDRIYYGKYFVTDASRIKMNITEAIKNNINKVEWGIDSDTQNWVPDNIIQGTDVKSIENSSKYETCRLDIYFVEPESESRIITSAQIDITSYYSPEWYDEFEYNVPNQTNNGKIEEANRTGILPRLPYISTNKYYINFNFNRNRNSQPQYKIGNTDTGSIIITTDNIGAYNFSISLYKLFQQLHEPEAYDHTTLVDGGAAMRFIYEDITLNGGAARITESETEEFGGLGARLPRQASDGGFWVLYANNKPITRIDTCYNRYYAAWQTPMGEWQSQPLDYLTVDRRNENITFKSLRGYDYTAHTGSQGELTLRKNRLTKEEDKLYKTMMFAPYILIYDTEKDRSYLGTYQGDTNYVEQQRNSRDFQLTIKEVDTIKY